MSKLLFCAATVVIVSACAPQGMPGGDPSTSGIKTIFSEPHSDPSGIAVDSSGVYWMTQDGGLKASNAGRIMKASVDGTNVMVLASGQDLHTGGGKQVTSIALDETTVYWVSAGAGTVMKVNKDGSSLTVLASAQSPASIAVDATYVYWTNTSDAPDGRVSKVAKGGGRATVVVSGLDEPIGLAIDETGVFWTEYWSGGIGRSGLDGRNATVMTKDQGGANYLAVDNASIYWTKGNDTVMRIDRNAGSPFLIAQHQNSPMSIAVDNQHVYWTLDDNQGGVMKANKDGSNVALFASALTYAACPGLALDSSAVYWTCTDGTVLKKAK